MKHPFLTVGTGAAVLASTLLAGGPASALSITDPRSPIGIGTPVTVASGLFTPLSAAVTNRGTSYVSQNFAGVLTKVTAGGVSSVVASAPPGEEIGAVSTRGGTVFYAQNMQPEGRALLRAMDSAGNSRTIADLGAYEAQANPDQVNNYGFVDLPAECAAQFAPDAPAGPASYSGKVDSHPYASLALRGGIYVADAGSNSIQRVGYNGAISTLAVLPASEPYPVSAELAARAGYPACVAGYSYRFEPVPTDIEVGPGGWLYVTSLPGGPEDASLGARGSVYKVNPKTGAVVQVATGFVGATGLAVSVTTGAFAVTELYGGPTGTGQVSVVAPGESTPTLSVPVAAPAAIELRRNSLYVTTNAFVPDPVIGAPQPIGKLLQIPLVLSAGVTEDSASTE